ncbi:helix-turn-helix transcriptional regulator [Paraburkholderia sp. EG287A]|uniref:helix-turn-helix transcriptional regulator n=1 Tax=unclassified Paraburkholderia TaxID=2615204 RepID=UPI0034D3645D
MSSAGDLNPLIDSIHDAGLGRSSWPEVLHALAERIGAQCISVQVGAPGAAWSLNDWSGIDPSFRRAYDDHYGALDPMTSFTARCQPGAVVTDPMIVSRSILDRSEFYQDWARPQGLNHFAGVRLSTRDGIDGLLGAGRGSIAPYRQQDLDVLASVLPHVQNALRTAHHLHGVCVREQARSDALDAFVHAVIIVDREARVIFANRAAEAMFAGSGGIATVQQRLVGLSAASTAQLHALIARATCNEGIQRAGGAMLLERQPPAGPLQVLVTPLGSRHGLPVTNAQGRAAMLMLVDSCRARRGLEARLTALFGLTPAEARVACELAEGRSPNDIAEGTRVMPSTVRTHLHHLFTKTATRGQGDLIRLIAHITVARID